MVVGIAQLHLVIPDNHSLKGKRKVVQKTVERVRSRFNIAIAEVGDHDLWQSIRLGFSIVGSDGRVVNSLMDRVISFIEELQLSELLEVEREVLPFGGHGP